MPVEARFLSLTRRHKRLSCREKRSLIDQYELGLGTIEGLAAEFGVHRNTAGNLLRSHGVRKGCRAHELLVEFKGELDARARQRAHARRTDDIRRLTAAIEWHGTIGDLMRGLCEADREGRLAEFGATVPRARSYQTRSSHAFSCQFLCTNTS